MVNTGSKMLEAVSQCEATPGVSTTIILMNWVTLNTVNTAGT